MEAIKRLKREKNAIILAHNYQPPDIQDLADLCGDSLELSIRASRTDAEVIVFCGVHFMAETASILSPGKTVLLPNLTAGCPMADMVTPEALKKKLKELPGVPVVTYVNSSAAVKALSTVCCTSANVVAVVESIDADEVLMVPDRNLARYAAARTRKKVHFWDGYCPIHDRLTPEQVAVARKAHPNAVFMAHPECRPEVLALADEILSTSGMIQFSVQSKAAQFIVGTEAGLLYPLQKACPKKAFFHVDSQMVCADMKKITPEDVIRSLTDFSGKVRVPEEIRVPALTAVTRMIAQPGAAFACE
ncbi:MAG: quinolinate synthase NadA [Desulfobacterales bacterium]|jgi:quinolinate synthase|nr:quinolinate synthase NadA [Desulfobacterales bacterium]